MAKVVFQGGDKLQAKLRKLAKKAGRSGRVECGFLEGATYPDGTSVATVAAIQEFGAPGKGIPPRPFFRTMIQQNSGQWGNDLAKLLIAYDYDVEKALTAMGVRMAEQLRESIDRLSNPPLSAVTLMLREMRHQNPSLVVTAATVGEAARLVAAGKDYSGASTKPLEDTGVMYAAVHSNVVMEGEG